MADPKLVELLRQGKEVWNRWREQQLGNGKIDLSEADLSYADLYLADLSSANLCLADLSGANLYLANLSGANLSSANLGNTDLGYANLSSADLRDTNLSYADLRDADLRDAILIDADLTGADLRAAKLSSTYLSGAIIGGSVFFNVDLRHVKGLADVVHRRFSQIALHTVQLPPDGSALHFLRGCGVPDEWIDFYRAQMMHPIQYHSCFISYSSKDEILAKRLHADLQAQGVRCWFAPHDMKTGDKIRPIIDQMIHQQDKLLLILSEDSVVSDWVEHEVETALARERKEKRTILFPIRLDNAILEHEYTGWAALVQHERHIGDFTNWTDPQAYNLAFERLLSDLKTQKQEY